MKLFNYLRFSLLSAVNTLALLILIIVLIAGYRVLSYEQQDNAEKIASKEVYLSNLASLKTDAISKPNIIFILYDDMGYGDIGAGVANPDVINTPNINRLAKNGVSFANFYSPAPVCTPARAGFLTGRLAPRAGLPHVVFPSGTAQGILFGKVASPNVNNRLPEEEITLANILKAAGYRTAMVGKWHIGDRSPSLPNDMGFDYFFGAHYSNDMEPFNLYRNTAVEVPAPVDQRYLSERYTQEVLDIVATDSKQPFFLYFAHNFPHDPLAVRDERLGKSSGGLYGDVLEEIDQGVGEMIAVLEQSGKLDNTLIIISSDNGPWYLGNAGHQRGRKGNTFEGGMRVPFIAHWPEKIAPRPTESAIAMGTDLVPTVLELLNLPLPEDRLIDGESILKLLTEGGDSPHDYLYYYAGEELFAVRDQRFKYRAAKGVVYGTDDVSVAPSIGQKEWLFDLSADPGESYDVSARYPEALQRLKEAYRIKLEDMKTNLRGWNNN